jgi:hypothetical protein
LAFIGGPWQLEIIRYKGISHKADFRGD